MNPEVIRIARKTRREIERHKEDLRNAGMSCWHDLCGLCAFASRVLQLRLQAAGFDAKLVQGNGDPKGTTLYATHVWVELDGKVVDITATQFTHKVYPKVYISDKPANFLYPTKRKAFWDWEEGQRPNLKYIRLFEKMVDKHKKQSKVRVVQTDRMLAS
jgi:hypothetical protein